MACRSKSRQKLKNFKISKENLDVILFGPKKMEKSFTAKFIVEKAIASNILVFIAVFKSMHLYPILILLWLI